MGKLKINKEAFIATVLAGTLALTGCGNKNEKNIIADLEPRTTGVTDFNPYWSGTDEDTFAILDVGNYEQSGTKRLKRKMKYCNAKNMPLGLVVTPKELTEEEIYMDIEYIKYIIGNYKVDFPIFLNIDGIITENSLDKETKDKLIKGFLEKCDKNNIYVGVYGKDTNLAIASKYLPLDGYPVYLVKEQEKLAYDKEPEIVQELDGSIKTDVDFKNEIFKRLANNPSNFAYDYLEKVNSLDELIELSFKYNMSMNDLLGFNSLGEEDMNNLENGKETLIRIPSKYNSLNPAKLGTDDIILKTPNIGCDISSAQGENVDWNSLKNNFEYVILKGATGMTPDQYFESNYTQASQNEIPVGVYFHNGIVSEGNEEEIKAKQEEQIDYFLSLLKGKNIEYPVYLNIQSDFKENIDKETIKDILDIWKNKTKEAGYLPGIYCNRSFYDYLTKEVGYDIEHSFEMWIGGGDQFSANENIDVELSDIKEPSGKSQYPNIQMFQCSNSVVNAGAGNHKGHIDVNACYKNYPGLNKTIEYSQEEKDASMEIKVTEIPNSEDEFEELYITAGIGSIALVTVGLPTVMIKHKLKQKKSCKYLKTKDKK